MRFEADPDFTISPEAGGVFLVGPEGGRVRIDGLGRRLWEVLPGTRNEIAGKIRGDGGEVVKDEVIDDWVTLFAAARLIRSDSPEKAAATDSWREKPAVPESGLPSVSAVVVTRNGEAHIRACLKSLLEQDRKLLEILVVDNGSTDQTTTIIRKEFPEAVILDPGRNLFYPGGLNYGIARAAGEAVLVLNDDVELESDVVHRMARRMREDAAAAAVVPELRLFHLRGFLNGIGNHVRSSGWGSDCFVGCVDVGQFRGLCEVPSACISAALIRKAAWREIGPFDAGYLAYYEDVDWSFRARLAGWRIAAEPEAVVYHKFSAYWKNMEGKLRLVARNRMRFLLRIFRGPELRAFFKSYLKEDLINMLSLLRQGKLSLAWAYARAYGSLVLHLPGIADSRRQIRRGSRGDINVADILALNPPFWTCMGPDGRPRLDMEMYSNYYRGVLGHKKS